MKKHIIAFWVIVFMTGCSVSSSPPPLAAGNTECPFITLTNGPMRPKPTAGLSNGKGEKPGALSILLARTPVHDFGSQYTSPCQGSFTPGRVETAYASV